MQPLAVMASCQPEADPCLFLRRQDVVVSDVQGVGTCLPDALLRGFSLRQLACVRSLAVMQPSLEIDQCTWKHLMAVPLLPIALSSGAMCITGTCTNFDIFWLWLFSAISVPEKLPDLSSWSEDVV